MHAGRQRWSDGTVFPPRPTQYCAALMNLPPTGHAAMSACSWQTPPCPPSLLPCIELACHPIHMGAPWWLTLTDAARACMLPCERRRPRLEKFTCTILRTAVWGVRQLGRRLAFTTVCAKTPGHLPALCAARPTVHWGLELIASTGPAHTELEAGALCYKYQRKSLKQYPCLYSIQDPST